MKILFLTYHYPPETGACSVRVEEFVKRWQAQGHEVTVVTGNPNYPKNHLYPGYVNRFISRGEDNGIRLVRTFTYVSRKGGLLRRALGQILFIFMGVIGGLLTGRHDVLIATSPPFTIGLAAVLLSKLKRLPLFFDVRDPYPLAAIELGVLTNKPLIKLLYGYERFIYANAFRVVTVTESFRRFLVDSGCQQENTRVVANGVNPRFFNRDEAADRAEICRHFKLEDKFNVVYTGTMGRVHDLRTMVEAARELRDDPAIQFVIVGHGVKQREVTSLVTQYQLQNLILLDPIPKEEVRRFLHIADIGFQALEDLRYIAGAHAIKLFEYMAMQVPVVFAGAGESHRLVEESQCGIACGTGDVKAVAAAITTIKNDPRLQLTYGSNGRRWVEKHYDRVKLADDFLDLLTDLNPAVLKQARHS